jgi:hypothetical protein
MDVLGDVPRLFQQWFKPSGPAASGIALGREREAAYAMRGTVIAVVLIGLTFVGCATTKAEDQPRSGRYFSAADMANIVNSPTRTLEELQLAFDRDKQRFYSIVNAYRHRKPGAASGRLVFSITVAPDGTISDCHLVSSTFSDSDFEDQMLSAAKRLHVGARAVPEATFPSYPIDVSN